MGEIVVIQFVTLDGVVSDPDGRWGTDHGGWAMRHGPVAGDRFRLGSRLEQGVQLYGRRTWEHFARLWPGRDGEYARLLNAVPKRVATRTGIDPAAWANSEPVEGDPLAWAEAERAARDVIVIGSLSLVHALAAADLVDEYRLITCPVATTTGARLFASPTTLTFAGAEPAAHDVLTLLRRP